MNDFQFDQMALFIHVNWRKCFTTDGSHSYHVQSTRRVWERYALASSVKHWASNIVDRMIPKCQHGIFHPSNVWPKREQPKLNHLTINNVFHSSQMENLFQFPDDNWGWNSRHRSKSVWVCVFACFCVRVWVWKWQTCSRKHENVVNATFFREFANRPQPPHIGYGPLSAPRSTQQTSSVDASCDNCVFGGVATNSNR